MAVTYTNAIKAARMTATRDTCANGTLELLAANDTVLAVFGLTAAGGTVATDVWTLAWDATSVSGEAGASTGTTATKAQIKDSGGTPQITGLTVGNSGTDITMANTSVASGQPVNIESAAITHAA